MLDEDDGENEWKRRKRLTRTRNRNGGDSRVGSLFALENVPDGSA